MQKKYHKKFHLKKGQRLLIVSNRLPITCSKNPKGKWQVKLSAGGLVTAMDPIIRQFGGLWIGWPGTIEANIKQLKAPLRQVALKDGYHFIPVLLDEKEKQEFYQGFSNEILWPLFHDLQTRCHFNPDFFQTYLKVNQKFARMVHKFTQPKDLIWIHDYHLMMVAEHLRKLGVKSKLAFFLHIPFPSLDIFMKLPWRSQILKAILQFDMIGFQTQRDLLNFMQCVRNLTEHKIDLRNVLKNHHTTLKIGKKSSTLGYFPIGIDYHTYSAQSHKASVAQDTLELRKKLSSRQLILGVDRLDYTKGITYKLKAFRKALRKFPSLRKKITLIQVVVPSREDIQEYEELRHRIEQLVGEINGQFTQPGWVPIHYMFSHLDRSQLLSFYRMAKIAMVTPLKDGMNLVAKEYCAAAEDNGVLILSEFAGTATQLKNESLLVNPYDIDGMAQAIYQAYSMKNVEAKKRMGKIRILIQHQDIFNWANDFLRTAFNPKK